ncbi:MAG: CapA family protein [Pseudomonadota bacterium]
MRACWLSLGVVFSVLVVPGAWAAEQGGADKSGVQAGSEGAPRSAARQLTVVVTGDTGFSRNHSPVHPKGVLKYGKRQPFAAATRGIASLIDGDINFTNIETVITARNGLKRDLKGQRGPFNFRSHPNSMRALVAAGFNVFSLSNNHTMDYRVAGLRDTLREMAALKREVGGLFVYAGAGEDFQSAIASESFTVRDQQIAFSAVGIATNNLTRHMASADRPGQAAYRIDRHYKAVVDALAATPAQYRMLSIHYGIEGRVRTDSRQIKEWRGQAANDNAIDLVIGHHAHVPRAIERSGDTVIFYGLGNFLHHGTANMGRKGVCKDFGVVGKVHLVATPAGRLVARAVEVTPVTQMHIAPKQMPASKGRLRIHALNYLASKLPKNPRNAGENLRFKVRGDGTGYYCFPGASDLGGKVGALCANWSGPSPVTSRSGIASSCRR